MAKMVLYKGDWIIKEPFPVVKNYFTTAADGKNYNGLCMASSRSTNLQIDYNP